MSQKAQITINGRVFALPRLQALFETHPHAENGIAQASRIIMSNGGPQTEAQERLVETFGNLQTQMQDFLAETMHYATVGYTEEEVADFVNKIDNAVMPLAEAMLQALTDVLAEAGQ